MRGRITGVQPPWSMSWPSTSSSCRRCAITKMPPVFGSSRRVGRLNSHFATSFLRRLRADVLVLHRIVNDNEVSAFAGDRATNRGCIPFPTLKRAQMHVRRLLKLHVGECARVAFGVHQSPRLLGQVFGQILAIAGTDDFGSRMVARRYADGQPPGDTLGK